MCRLIIIGSSGLFEERKADLQNWIRTLMPTYDAISVLLSILRKNSRKVNCLASMVIINILVWRRIFIC